PHAEEARSAVSKHGGRPHPSRRRASAAPQDEAERRCAARESRAQRRRTALPGSGLRDAIGGLGALVPPPPAFLSGKDIAMRIQTSLRAAFLAIAVIAAGATAVYADGGPIRFNVLKAGFVVGGSGGSGSFTFQGRTYGISIGGISYGFTFGAANTHF